MANRVKYFIDNDENKQGQYYCEKKIISRFEIEDPKNSLILLATSLTNARVIYTQLLQMREIPINNIIIPRSGYIRAYRGEQYFDYFKPDKDEVFIDAGSSFGNTSIEFVNWCKTNQEDYKKIFAFDARKNSKNFYEKVIKQVDLHDAKFIGKGLYE